MNVRTLYKSIRFLRCSAPLLALFLFACGGEKLAQLKSQASGDFACPVEQVSRTELQSYVEKVTACGKENVYVYDRGMKTWVSPLNRAAFDLECPKDQVTTQVIDNRSVGATGCGRKIVYVLSQTVVPSPWGPRTQSTWIANTSGSARKE